MEELMSICNYINWFFLYSFLGYLLECIVLTVEYKRPVVDRGFGHGPFCVIYGFGAVGACLLLSPLSDHPIELYTASMTMATTMELITANVMIRLFGSFWWDHLPGEQSGVGTFRPVLLQLFRRLGAHSSRLYPGKDRKGPGSPSYPILCF